MSEEKSGSCGCGTGCNCKSKCGRLLQNFFMIIVIILLAGIFYMIQGMMAMCPMMNDAHHGSKGKSAYCPIMIKGQVPAQK